jgi:hypothetical protein
MEISHEQDIDHRCNVIKEDNCQRERIMQTGWLCYLRGIELDIVITTNSFWKLLKRRF